ncbi:MAG: Rrf2 family transcriptional regulator [Phycisphaerae bacterium]
MQSVLKISEAASLGLHSMMVLARDPARKLSVGELSKILRSSEAHLAKVLQRLAKVRLVKSTRGPRGGFLLGRPAAKINLLEVYEAIEGPLAMTKCLLPKPICCGGKCVFGDVIKNVNRQISEHLAMTKLSSQNLEE